MAVFQVLHKGGTHYIASSAEHVDELIKMERVGDYISCYPSLNKRKPKGKGKIVKIKDIINIEKL